MYLRADFDDSENQQVEEPEADVASASPMFADIGVNALVHYESMLTDPKTDIHFERTKKGGLRVYVKQID